jgi:hypothetical protein
MVKETCIMVSHRRMRQRSMQAGMPGMPGSSNRCGSIHVVSHLIVLFGYHFALDYGPCPTCAPCIVRPAPPLSRPVHSPCLLPHTPPPPQHPPRAAPHKGSRVEPTCGSCIVPPAPCPPPRPVHSPSVLVSVMQEAAGIQMWWAHEVATGLIVPLSPHTPPPHSPTPVPLISHPLPTCATLPAPPHPTTLPSPDTHLEQPPTKAAGLSPPPCCCRTKVSKYCSARA